MNIATTLRMTFYLVRYSLLPPGNKKGSLNGAAYLTPMPAPGGHITVPVAAVPHLLCDLNQALDQEGHLHLFFPAAAAIAAPFLLFRLKRTGFSDCLVQAGTQGLTLSAQR